MIDIQAEKGINPKKKNSLPDKIVTFSLELELLTMETELERYNFNTLVGSGKTMPAPSVYLCEKFGRFYF